MTAAIMLLVWGLFWLLVLSRLRDCDLRTFAAWCCIESFPFFAVLAARHLP